MSIKHHSYSHALVDAAETFLIGQFQAPTQFTEAPHLDTLIEAAMHIVTGAAWVQPDSEKESRMDAPVGEGGRGDEDDEDEED